jgi:EH domain-containing protein 1
MGPDSSPKKWSLKEQRAAYLQWFALADEGLLHGDRLIPFFTSRRMNE